MIMNRPSKLARLLSGKVKSIRKPPIKPLGDGEFLAGFTVQVFSTPPPKQCEKLTFEWQLHWGKKADE